MGCSGSSEGAKKPAQQNTKGAATQQSAAKSATPGGTRASEYKSPQGITYPSLEPPVIDNKQALEKGYISAKGAGQTKMDEAVKRNEERKRERKSEESDESSDEADSSEDNEENSEESD